MKLIKVIDHFETASSQYPEYSQIWLGEDLVFEGPYDLDLTSPFDCESVLMGVTKTLFLLGEQYDLEATSKVISQ